MFEYDVGLRCPVGFSVDFVIPTSGPDVYDKTMLVNIVDFYRTIRLTVFRPARNLTTTATFGTFGVSYSMHQPAAYSVSQKTPPTFLAVT